MNLFVLTTVTLVLTGVLIPSAHAEEQTTVYVQGTIPLDKGKPSLSGGATYSQTRGNSSSSTTTTVDVNTDGKNLNVKGSQTNQRR
ncbi:hypothetical protein [Nitrobacter sp. Nb-311A]|uniref:hypothetical protein n=1 Tax=Nitrobacter sp. Nb-311A TaxID=314253 RepID=UPI00103BDEF2|nr:hypothetical protein [Nitrobacter sp. Nb-311A]